MRFRRGQTSCERLVPSSATVPVPFGTGTDASSLRAGKATVSGTVSAHALPDFCFAKFCLPSMIAHAHVLVGKFFS